MSASIRPSCSLYIFSLENHQYWAFKQMRLGIKPLKQEVQIDFFKLLGCGGGNGFSLIPDFSTYALLCVWKKGVSAEVFETENEWFKEYLSRTGSCIRHDLHSVQGHGSWNAKNPFIYREEIEEDLRWAVITRASIRKSKLLEFWRKVPKVSSVASGFPGSEFSIGIGEWPLVEQATFSIWQDKEKMKYFAYKDQAHSEVVKLTRDRNWYSEELFVRFQLLQTVDLKSNPNEVRI